VNNGAIFCSVQFFRRKITRETNFVFLPTARPRTRGSGFFLFASDSERNDASGSFCGTQSLSAGVWVFLADFRSL
jgi:hypothetical protein